MKSMILCLALLLGGCSSIALTTRSDSPTNCTTSYAAPAFDAIMTPVAAVGSTVLAVNADSPIDVRLSISLAISSILFGYSAVKGVDKVDYCRF
tara:strand:+ start:1046 stop:1327 length:282 start_codon:yes stop_codon:yes gene_type:complete